MSTSNGGQLTYKDLDTDEVKVMPLEGEAQNRSQVVRFDFVPPAHCVSDTTPCETEPLTAPDITDSVST